MLRKIFKIFICGVRGCSNADVKANKNRPVLGFDAE